MSKKTPKETLSEIKSLKNSDVVSVYPKNSSLPYKISVENLKKTFSDNSNPPNNIKKYGFWIYPEEQRIAFLEGDESEFNSNYSWRYFQDSLEAVAFQLIKTTGELKEGSFLRITNLINISNEDAAGVTHISTKPIVDGAPIPNSLEISTRIGTTDGINPEVFNTFKFDSNYIYYLEFFEYLEDIVPEKYPVGVWITNGAPEV